MVSGDIKTFTQLRGSAGESALVAQLYQKFKGQENFNEVAIPQSYQITNGAWAKANRLGELIYELTKRKFGEGTETMGVLLGSKNESEIVIRDVGLIKHHAEKFRVRASQDFSTGLKQYKSDYRIIGMWHTHPFDGGQFHSPTDDKNLAEVLFLQAASNNSFLGDNDMRLLDLPMDITIDNSADGVNITLREAAGHRTLRFWLPGCRLESGGLEHKIRELDVLYNRLNVISYVLSLVLDLKGGYHAEIMYAPRGPNNALDMSKVISDKIGMERIAVPNDVAFTEDELLRMIKNNVIDLEDMHIPSQPRHPQAREKRQTRSTGKKPPTLGSDGRLEIV